MKFCVDFNAISHCSKLVHFNSLQVVIQTWRDLQVLMWNDGDVITEDHLRLIDDVIVLLTNSLQKGISGDVRLYVCNKSRMNEWISWILLLGIMMF